MLRIAIEMIGNNLDSGTNRELPRGAESFEVAVFLCIQECGVNPKQTP
jgi:hypothetical protein